MAIAVKIRCRTPIRLPRPEAGVATFPAKGKDEERNFVAGPANRAMNQKHGKAPNARIPDPSPLAGRVRPKGGGGGMAIAVKIRCRTPIRLPRLEAGVATFHARGKDEERNFVASFHQCATAAATLSSMKRPSMKRLRPKGSAIRCGRS